MKLSQKPVIDHGEKLNQEQIDALKQQIDSAWSIKEGKLFRHFDVANYTEARALVEKFADLADEVNHHPDITFSFKYVEVVLFTHDVDGLAEGDFVVAAKMDEIIS